MFGKLFSAAAFLSAALSLSGCGSGEPPLFAVSGTITYDAKPIPKGIIHFDPDPTKGGKGQSGFANILQGKYDTANQGKGVRGGPYVLRISGFDGKEAGEAPWGQALFPEHWESKELPAAKSTLDISIAKKK